MHMSGPANIEFTFSNLIFVDMGLSIYNEERNEKYYFIKMIHENKLNRNVHLLAIAYEHL